MSNAMPPPEPGPVLCFSSVFSSPDSPVSLVAAHLDLRSLVRAGQVCKTLHAAVMRRCEAEWLLCPHASSIKLPPQERTLPEGGRFWIWEHTPTFVIALPDGRLVVSDNGPVDSEKGCVLLISSDFTTLEGSIGTHLDEFLPTGLALAEGGDAIMVVDCTAEGDTLLHELPLPRHDGESLSFRRTIHRRVIAKGTLPGISQHCEGAQYPLGAARCGDTMFVVDSDSHTVVAIRPAPGRQDVWDDPSGDAGREECRQIVTFIGSPAPDPFPWPWEGHGDEHPPEDSCLQDPHPPDLDMRARRDGRRRYR